MGLEARCHGRHGDAEGEGRLQYEGGRILFRGPFRLDLAVKNLKKVSAAGDELVLAWGRELAAFSLGAAMASKWARRILNPPSLLDKLGIKPEQPVAMLGPFDAAFVKDLAFRARLSAWPGLGKEYDVVLLSVETPADLISVTALLPAIASAGALWIVYPKGGQGAIKESHVREAGLAAGLVDNKTCAFSATLTALRWVRPRASR
jgi:hypothetical protein